VEAIMIVSRRLSLRLFVVLTLLVSFISIPAIAQTVTGTMRGSVTDRSGGALPGVTVTIRNADTGLERILVTDKGGVFNTTFLPTGLYNVQAELTGFGAMRHNNVRVDLNHTVVQDFTLDPAVTETVTVNAQAPHIDTTDGEIKQTMRSEEIMNIPQSTQTSFLGLASIMGGYQEQPPAFGSGISADNPALSTGSSVVFNGTGTRGTTFQINGVNNDDSSENQHRQGVALATIQSFQILSNNYSSEFGRGSGAVVLVQTKSGTNEVSGELYGYDQDNRYNARSKLDVLKPPHYRRDYGLTSGFPIMRDKLFAFVNADIVQDNGSSILTRALWLPSDLAYPRLTRNNDTPENRAWQDSILARYPKFAPNAAVITGNPRAYQYPQALNRPARDYSGRLDFNATQSNSVIARYQKSKQQLLPNGELIIGEQGVQDLHQSNFGLTWTGILSSNTVQEGRYGLGLRATKWDIYAGNTTPIVRFGTSIANGTILGNASAFPIDRFQRDQQFVYNISSTHWASHTLKLGTDIRRSSLNDHAEDRNRGFWNFGASLTCVGVTYPNGYAMFMDGCIPSFQKSFGPAYLENQLREYNGYGQDDWRVRDNLVLNLGARYEWVGVPKEKKDRIDYGFKDSSYIDPRLGFAYTPDWDGNRFWRALTGGSGKFSIRGGYGTFHGRVFQSVFSQVGASIRYNPPNAASYTVASTNLADPLGANGIVFVPGKPPTGRITLTTADPNLKMPETRQWNLTFERQVFSQSRLRASYIGTLGKNLLQYRFDNLPVKPGAPGSNSTWVVAQDWLCAGTLQPGLNLAATAACPNAVPIAANEVSIRVPRTNDRRPDARYGTNLVVSNIADSTYHAGELEWESGMIHGFQGRVTYTYSKALDVGSEATSSGTGDINIFPPDAGSYSRGLSRFDTRHRFTMTGVYLLPFFRDRKDWMEAVLGGWQVATVIRLSSGTPFTVVDSGASDVDFDGVGNSRPVCIDPNGCGDLRVNSPVDSQNKLQRKSFRHPRYGDTLSDLMGRNTYFTDGFESIDLGLYKSFRVPVRSDSIMLRLDVFNVTNHVTYGFPSSDFNATTFGRITSTAYAPRTLQLGLRYLY
jgi:hypothetical protein